MKCSTLALTLFTSIALAAPVEPTPKKELYTLRVVSESAPEIDGSYLTLSPTSSSLGIYPSTKSFIKFYTVPSSHGNNLELHRYTPLTPTKPEVIAFVGSSGLKDFSVATPTSPACDYQNFDLVPKPRGGGKPDNLVTYSGSEGSWVAFQGPDGWRVSWKDADAFTTANYMNIDVVYEPVMVAQ